MLTFNYTATINALPVDDDKRFIETLTGEVEAEGHAQAEKQASRLAFNRCRKLEQEQGGIIGYENVQVVSRAETVPTVPQDYFARARIEVAFLNTLKQQIRAVTKALDTTQQVFKQSLEATSVKHAVEILWSELEVHGLLPEPRVMTPQDYMRYALRTLYPGLSTSERLALCGLGLSGETGEVADLLKKFLYHRNGKPLDTEKVKSELGDMLWYYFILLDTLGISFEEVMMANAEKLEKRHPNGFNPHYSSDSHASEVEL